MRWASYRSRRDDRDHAALIDGDMLLALPGTMVEVLERYGTDLAAAADDARAHPFEREALDGAALLAPVPRPPSIRDFMAFEEHVVNAMKGIGSTVNPVWYAQPVFYFSNPAGVLGPEDDVPISPGSIAFDYELEVAAIIGRPGRDLDPATAEQHIAGYTIFADWSARDLQRTEMAVGLGPTKGKDGATTLGPYLVTPEELTDAAAGKGYDLVMSAQVNGRDYSSGRWSSLYWSFGQMLAYASRGTTLHPGDVIGSGTVGSGCILELQSMHGPRDYPWLAAGDRCRLAVERLGEISVGVLPGTDPVPLA